MLFVLAALLLDGPKPPPERPAVLVRLVRPREQGERLLALFDGAKVPHPAAALAGYKRAKGGDTGLGKPLDAAIAALNPDMVAELATLDDASFALGWSADGRAAWNAAVPHDDGTFAAFATAGMLTEGAAAPPLDDLRVDRLGPRPTATLAATGPGRFLLGSTREGLAEALRRSREPRAEPPIDSGWIVHVDPAGLDRPGAPVLARRLGVALARLGGSGLDASVRLDGETLHVEAIGRLGATPALARATIPPAWLDAIPPGAAAAFAVALDPSPEAWKATFDWLDAIDRADPARANLAPLRLRLNLLATGIGLKPDVELWPLLVGVSGFVIADQAGKADGALVSLHAKDEAAARRLHEVTLRRVIRTLAGRKGADEGDPVILTAAGRQVATERRGADVLIAWGDSALAKADGPADSKFRTLVGARAQRFAAAWPGRVGALAGTDAPPAVWVGSFEGATSVDSIRWPGLKAIVRRVVDRIPLDPPPDAATPLCGRGR